MLLSLHGCNERTPPGPTILLLALSVIGTRIDLMFPLLTEKLEDTRRDEHPEVNKILAYPPQAITRSGRSRLRRFWARGNSPTTPGISDETLIRQNSELKRHDAPLAALDRSAPTRTPLTQMIAPPNSNPTGNPSPHRHTVTAELGIASAPLRPGSGTKVPKPGQRDQGQQDPYSRRPHPTITEASHIPGSSSRAKAPGRRDHPPRLLHPPRYTFGDQTHILVSQ